MVKLAFVFAIACIGSVSPALPEVACTDLRNQIESKGAKIAQSEDSFWDLSYLDAENLDAAIAERCDQARAAVVLADELQSLAADYKRRCDAEFDLFEVGMALDAPAARATLETCVGNKRLLNWVEWALIALVILLIAGVGYKVLASSAKPFIKILSLIFLVIFLVILILALSASESFQRWVEFGP